MIVVNTHNPLDARQQKQAVQPTAIASGYHNRHASVSAAHGQVGIMMVPIQGATPQAGTTTVEMGLPVGTPVMFAANGSHYLMPQASTSTAQVATSSPAVVRVEAWDPSSARPTQSRPGTRRGRSQGRRASIS